MENIHVSLKGDIVGYIGSFPVTNTFVASVVGSLVLVLIVFLLSRNVKLVPSKTQIVIEGLTDGVRGYVAEVLEDQKLANKVFPLILSLFVFILFLNLFKFLPGTESLTYKGVHILKPAHSDLNMTVALGIVAFVFVQFVGMFVLGFFKYWSKFINFSFKKIFKAKGFLGKIKQFFLEVAKLSMGMLELISEVAKLISLSFRLFGNIMVGGIFLMLLISISAYFIPLPMLLFELFVAFLQAALFSVLTLFYIKMAVTEPH
ncbi:hypothetical protein CSB11_02910 [Candidatus Campbellbacteria bacterium]|nr:MAG: hypothetical protein CSB11_02910 [Candidatus Campbellbacteria bacterium]